MAKWQKWQNSKTAKQPNSCWTAEIWQWELWNCWLYEWVRGCGGSWTVNGEWRCFSNKVCEGKWTVQYEYYTRVGGITIGRKWENGRFWTVWLIERRKMENGKWKKDIDIDIEWHWLRQFFEDDLIDWTNALPKVPKVPKFQKFQTPNSKVPSALHCSQSSQSSKFQTSNLPNSKVPSKLPKVPKLPSKLPKLPKVKVPKLPKLPNSKFQTPKFQCSFQTSQSSQR